MQCGNKKVFVVIPNKNGVRHLVYSLSSLADTLYGNFETVVVDDQSTDESLAFIKKNFPAIKVIMTEVNKGFAGAVNEGIRYSRDHGAEYIAIFNSDIKVLPEWMEFAVDLCRKRPDAGLVGFTEVSREREDLFCRLKMEEVEYKEVKRLCGCLFICPAKVFRHIGIFDEDYFMYGEDNDFFSRLTRAGYSILETNIPVWHYGAGASQGGSFLATWLTYRNAIRYSLKNESFFGICRMVFSLLNQGCNRFLYKNSTDAFAKRIRRYNPFINFLLIVMSCGWNIFHIISTLRARWDSIRQIKKRRDVTI